MKQKQAGYPLEFKLQAIALVTECRQPVAEIARSLGVPKSTLFDWVQQQAHGDEETQGRKNRRSGEVLRLKRELESRQTK